MRNARKMGIGGLAFMAVGSLVSGCGPAGNMAARSLGEIMVTQAVVSGVRNEIEGPRGTAVNVGNSASANERQLYVWVYKDSDGDGKRNLANEILSEVNGPVDLSKLGLDVYLNSDGTTNYSAWDSSGNLIGNTPGILGRGFCTSSNVFSGDFMDNLNGSPDGTYDIRAFNGGETFSKEVTIYRSEPVSSSNQ